MKQSVSSFSNSIKKPETIAIIGRGYGDEGKGLATDFFSLSAGKKLVVRHNGGAQSGHTVDRKDKRIVFHELGSGSLNGAETFWAKTYLPDLYKLAEEWEAFCRITGLEPVLHADERTCITLIDDVLLNMAIETARGEDRHGSCGMGINEAYLRAKAGFGITIRQLKEVSFDDLFDEMKRIRREYLPTRLRELGLEDREDIEYLELLRDENVLRNVLTAMKENVQKVQLVRDVAGFFAGFDRIIFESGQGLLLDAECEESMPHVTASRTGLTNPMQILEEAGLDLNEVVYVARSYLTRHGAGPLACECDPKQLGNIEPDLTNVTNPWQGDFRFAFYGSVEAFLKPIMVDCGNRKETKVSLLITHLNETEGKVRFDGFDLTPGELQEKTAEIFRETEIYQSYSRYSEEMKKEP